MPSTSQIRTLPRTEKVSRAVVGVDREHVGDRDPRRPRAAHRGIVHVLERLDGLDHGLVVALERDQDEPPLGARKGRVGRARPPRVDAARGRRTGCRPRRPRRAPVPRAGTARTPRARRPPRPAPGRRARRASPGGSEAEGVTPGWTRISIAPIANRAAAASASAASRPTVASTSTRRRLQSARRGSTGRAPVARSVSSRARTALRSDGVGGYVELGPERRQRRRHLLVRHPSITHPGTPPSARAACSGPATAATSRSPGGSPGPGPSRPPRARAGSGR